MVSNSFASVYATEASAPMRKILKSNGIQESVFTQIHFKRMRLD